MPDIKTIAILGANGTVGSQVARLLVSRLDVKVFLVCRTMKKAQEVKLRIQASILEEKFPGTMISADFSSLHECIPCCDWVFESVAEDLSIKWEMYRQVILFLRPDTLVSTGTSSFLIRQLTEPFGEDFKRRFYGTHFFNPPDKLTLLEFIQTDWNELGISLEFESFLRQQLGRRTIKVKDMHGFLANRIGALFLNEVALLAEQYINQGGIGYIDALMGRFTGRAMPPLMTIDYIGLDVFTVMLGNVRKDSQPNVNCNQNPEFLDELISKGYFGRKSSHGLYTQTILPDGFKQKWVFDLKLNGYQLLQTYGFPFAAKMTELQTQGYLASSFQALVDCTDEEAMICKYLLLRYIAIACQVSIEAAFDMKDVDTAIEDGYGWVSPRKLVFLLGGTAGIKKILSSNGNLKHALVGVDAEKLEIFQIPAIDSDLRFFSYGRK